MPPSGREGQHASALPPASAADHDELLPFALLGPPLSPEQQLEVRDRYLGWASLLKRVFGDDVLVCSRCGHRPMRVIAAIDDPPLVKTILDHLGLPAERPAISLARSPPQLELDDDLGDSDFGDSDLGDSDFDVD